MTTTLTATTPVRNDIPEQVASAAVDSLIAEVRLSGKPGLVGPDGSRGHSDMNSELMQLSARTLGPTFCRLAEHGAQLPVGQELRDALGRAGRQGETQMMEATGGVNTHRGAIWNLGLMVTGTVGLIATGTPVNVTSVTRRAGEIASYRDSALDLGLRPGARARRKYRVGGAVSEAASGFPHVRAIVDAIRTSLADGYSREDARLIGLLTSMSSLDDTCILHRGGTQALEFVSEASYRLLSETTRTGLLDRQALTNLDRRMTVRRLSPGGSADLLACALFLMMKDE
jgi:triphosphoribosyl-dephospho-CoA synthase